MLYKKLFVVFFFVSCFIFAQRPMGTRSMGIHVTTAQNQLYDSAVLNQVLPPCIKNVNLFFSWKDLEPSPYIYSHTKADTNLSIVNAYYPLRGLGINLQIAPINSNHKEVPPDLFGNLYSDPIVIDRFKNMIDTVFAKLNNPSLVINSLSIGNEHDAYIGNNATTAHEYKVFYDSVKTYIKSKHPTLKIGTTFTYGGLTGSSSALYQQINQYSDILSLTYYGINSNFSVKAPICPLTDFVGLTTLYPGKPIYIQECGYPSSPTCGSSDAQQAQFITHVFNSWDNLYSHIPSISFFQLTEWSQAQVDTFAVYYGISTPAFKDFLKTLGMRTYLGMGTNKIAYDSLVSQAYQRRACPGAGMEDDLLNSNVNIFPNPCTSSFTLQLDDIPSASYSIKFYDLMGRRFFEKPFFNYGSSSQQTFDITYLDPQIFICEIRIGEQKIFRKINKIHE